MGSVHCNQIVSKISRDKAFKGGGRGERATNPFIYSVLVRFELQAREINSKVIKLLEGY